MPAPSKRPTPPARMVALLTIERDRLLAERGQVTRRDFRAAWAICWNQMVAERAWAHSTPLRRTSRGKMIAARSEARSAFLGEPSAFHAADERLTTAAAGMCLDLGPDQIPKALLAAIAHVELPEPQDQAGA